jgi:hypothetical protein
VEDIAYLVIAAQQKPDHATIARFRARHEDALAELFDTPRPGWRRLGTQTEQFQRTCSSKKLSMRFQPSRAAASS